MVLTDFSNTIKKLWEKTSFHKHFKELVAGASVDCLFAVQMSLSISLATKRFGGGCLSSVSDAEPKERLDDVWF